MTGKAVFGMCRIRISDFARCNALRFLPAFLCVHTLSELIAITLIRALVFKSENTPSWRGLSHRFQHRLNFWIFCYYSVITRRLFLPFVLRGLPSTGIRGVIKKKIILISQTRDNSNQALTTKKMITIFAVLLTLSSLTLLSNLFFSSSATINFNSLWAICYFSNSAYILFGFSSLLYLLPNIPSFSSSNSFSSSSSFTSLEGFDLLRLLITPFLLILMLHVSWSGPSLTAWFGHIIFSSFQYKVTYLLFIFGLTYIFSTNLSTHYSSMMTYDFTLVTFNFFFWVWLTFFSNNLFTFVFFIELLSASITLLLVTSTFSSSHFYNNISYSKHSYFSFSTPTAFLQTLLFFFWITLVSSILLFLLVLLFYIKILTFDWNITDSVLIFLYQCSNITQVFTLSLIWLLLLTCVFIKCGTVPFYFWKPTFFKGMSLTSLFFYVYVYYFSIFFYFTYVLLFLLNEFFFLNLYLVVLLSLVATLGIASLLFESFYIKSFLALSSILNSILIFLGMCSYQATDLLFLI